MRLVRPYRLPVERSPASDPLSEQRAAVHDLLRPLVAGEHGDQDRLGLVCLVDRERVVRHQLGERVRDPVEQVVQALLGEDVVEDIGELPVGLHERFRAWGFGVAGTGVQGSRRGHSRGEVTHGHSLPRFRCRKDPPERGTCCSAYIRRYAATEAVRIASPPKARSRRGTARSEAASGCRAAPAGNAPSARSTTASATRPMARTGSLRTLGARAPVERPPPRGEVARGTRYEKRTAFVCFAAGARLGAAGVAAVVCGVVRGGRDRTRCGVCGFSRTRRNVAAGVVPEAAGGSGGGGVGCCAAGGGGGAGAAGGGAPGGVGAGGAGGVGGGGGAGGAGGAGGGGGAGSATVVMGTETGSVGSVIVGSGIPAPPSEAPAQRPPSPQARNARKRTTSGKPSSGRIGSASPATVNPA